MLQCNDLSSFTNAEFITVVIVDGSDVISTLGSDTLKRTPGVESSFAFFLGLTPELQMLSLSIDDSHLRLVDTPRSRGTSSVLLWVPSATTE